MDDVFQVGGRTSQLPCPPLHLAQMTLVEPINRIHRTGTCAGGYLGYG